MPREPNREGTDICFLIDDCRTGFGAYGLVKELVHVALVRHAVAAAAVVCPSQSVMLW